MFFSETDVAGDAPGFFEGDVESCFVGVFDLEDFGLVCVKPSNSEEAADAVVNVDDVIAWLEGSEVVN